MNLTKRQHEIYEYVRGFLDENGYAPSLEEIAGHFGLSSVATVHEHLENLQAKGILKRDPNRSRAVELARTSAGSPRAARWRRWRTTRRSLCRRTWSGGRRRSRSACRATP